MSVTINDKFFQKIGFRSIVRMEGTEILQRNLKSQTPNLDTRWEGKYSTEHLKNVTTRIKSKMTSSFPTR